MEILKKQKIEYPTSVEFERSSCFNSILNEVVISGHMADVLDMIQSLGCCKKMFFNGYSVLEAIGVPTCQQHFQCKILRR